jgi:hypothetical protein
LAVAEKDTGDAGRKDAESEALDITQNVYLVWEPPI